MNRIDRLFAILLLFQRRSRLRAEDLAEEFGISRRTVYRDVAALTEMGVPIATLPGEGYELMEGYFLPPLVFTPDEASAVFLGARMLALQASGALPQAAESALAKIELVLPPAARQRSEQLTRIIQFVLPRQGFSLDDPRLMTLQKAILERRVIAIRYHSYNRNEVTEREVEPDALSYSEGNWYFSGYCRLRRAGRSFRLERTESLRLLPERFNPRQPEADVVPTVEVQLRIAESALRWVRERQHYGFVTESAIPGSGDRVFIYRLHTFREILPWLLSWGRAVHVIAPSEARLMAQDEIQQMLEHYGE